jgi:hypothetical protein
VGLAGVGLKVLVGVMVPKLQEVVAVGLPEGWVDGQKLIIDGRTKFNREVLV